MVERSKCQGLIWPEPLIVNPTAPHTHSIILLHGRGSDAEHFGIELLKNRNSEDRTLGDCFPGAKFIFPTAKKRRSTAIKRIPINQWFDNFSLGDPSERQHLQYDGIRETSAFVHDLIEKEASLVGLSHGCAAALHVLLNFKRQESVGEGSASFAAFVGMSGWLPFAEILDPRDKKKKDEDEEDYSGPVDDDIFGSDGGHDDHGDDVFGFDGEHDEYDDNSKTEKDCDEAEEHDSLELRQLRAVNTTRDIASLPPLSRTDEALTFARTPPTFLGHGRNDEKVPIKLGSQEKDVLEALGCRVRWKDYDEGHWYKVPDEIGDIVDFLRTEAGFGAAGAPEA
ncbi:putative phospholipase/carboxylesterase [Phyllosticta citrichinensis]|uniref:Acyl-protein thioesterase 1 n=1 Tax=Phyllosticta citrichinensis TaxID=1130410 RepID=A0ABR1XFF8_9PEZI